MLSQRLMKLFGLSTAVAMAAALITWWLTEDWPAPWVLWWATLSAVAALLTGLIGRETRPRAMLRFLAALFALVAAISFTADWTSARDGLSTSLLQHLQNFTPSLISSAKYNISRGLTPALWDPVMLTILSVPTSLLFALLAALAGYAGRPRRQVQIFVN